MMQNGLSHGVNPQSDAPAPGSLEAECRALGIDPAGVLDFAANINPLGPPRCLEVALGQAVKLAATYPDPDCCGARAVLARFHHVPPESILLGNGATELLHLIMRTFHSERMLVLGPAYHDYARAGELAGSQVHLKTAAAGRLFRHDLEAMHHVSDYHLVVMGNPNDPTGTFTRPTEIIEWAAGNPETFFLVDETYTDFVDRPGASLIGIDGRIAANVVVVKSFSKFFAIPGLRLGMAWATPEVIGVLAGRREQWSVNAVAQKIAGLLYDEEGYIAATHRLMSQERSFLTRGLTQLGFRVFDSPANFMLLRIENKGVTSSVLRPMILRNGVFVRDCSDFEGLGAQFLRVAVRRHDENERLLDAIEKALHEMMNDE